MFFRRIANLRFLAARGALRPTGVPSPLTIESREDAEAAAIALLCLLFASPSDEPPPTGEKRSS